MSLVVVFVFFCLFYILKQKQKQNIKSVFVFVCVLCAFFLVSILFSKKGKKKIVTLA